MDQNKSSNQNSGSQRQFRPQPAARGSFMPAGRSFGAPASVPVQNAPAPMPPVAEQSQNVTFAPQQFRQSTAPAPVAKPQNFKPLTFTPRTPEKKPKFGGKLKLPKLSRNQQLIAGAALLLIVVGGAVFNNLTADRTQEVGVKTKGRKVSVATPTITSTGLETSCYTIDLPSEYKVTSTAGCSSVMSALQASDPGISLVGTNSSQAFTMKSAPYQIREQLKQLGKVTDYRTAPAEVNDVKALKVLYAINDGGAQVMLYVPTPPATYVNNSAPTGGFMIRGGYANADQQSSFDSLVQSLKWVR